MHFTTIATTLTTLLLASASMALPATASTGATATDLYTTLDDIANTNSTDTADLTKRQWMYKKVRYCENSNGGGRCVTQSFRHGLCYNMDPWWNDRVSSIYPESNWRCRMHLNRDCRGGSRDVGPNWGINELKSVGWNDRMSSIDCFSQAG
ncbi:putative beta gamma crystallin [Diplodia seriata]|uniref:Putative beta gamma crystallin n=1 Tax=Diplodia seriata TaxID=420778 RepID=A0A0G2HBX9_9PEZI|nr:putative beta gamma crystallin [Diplodia seriata]